MRASFAGCVVVVLTTSFLAAEEEPKQDEGAKATVQSRSWGPEQMTGAPDTGSLGDHSTAWASESPDDRDEWVDLRYAAKIRPVEIHVYQTYNPGALARISGFTSGDMEAELWSGKDPFKMADGVGLAKIPLDTKLSTSRIRLHLSSKTIEGWNEIDAVALVDAEGKKHWATAARASTTYAGGDSTKEWVTKPSADSEAGPRVVVVPEVPIPVFDPVVPAPAPAPPPAPAAPATTIDRLDGRIKALEAELEALKVELSRLKALRAAGE